MTFRRSALWIALFLSVLAGGAALYFHGRPAPVVSIEQAPTYQSAGLLSRAWALPVARLYGPRGYVFQDNPSFCGPTSIADLLRSEGHPAGPAAVLDGSGIKPTSAGILPGGLTLDQEADVLRRQTGKAVTVMRGLSLDAFRDEMRRSNDPSRRLIVNFTRAPLFGRGHGHFSPILGYLAKEDLVFVGDVNASYRPFLVPTGRLYEAQDTIDQTSHARRGVLEVEAPQGSMQ